MRIPGQEFDRVRMKTARDGASDLRTCEAISFKGGFQNGTAKNYNCAPSISSDLVCLLSLFALHGVRLLFEPLPLRRIGSDVLVQIAEGGPSSSRFVDHLLALSYHTDWNRKWNRQTRVGTLRAAIRVLPNTAYKFCQVVHFF